MILSQIWLQNYFNHKISYYNNNDYQTDIDNNFGDNLINNNLIIEKKEKKNDNENDNSTRIIRTIIKT